MTHHHVLLLLVLYLFASCGIAQESALQTQFEDRYEVLVSRISKRDESVEQLQRVKAIWLSTQKQLLSINAEIEAKKLDVSVSSGRQQAQALDELIAMAGARERTLLDGINQLDTIAEGGTAATLLAPGMEGTGERRAISSQQVSGKKHGSVSIRIEPEDVGTSGLP